MLHRAVQETGQHERDGSALSSRLAAYAQAGGLALPDVGGAIPYWGGAFLAWVAIRDGLVPPANPADPESWRNWGHPLAEPVAGSIVILTGGGGTQKTLCGVVARLDPPRVFVVGPHDGAIGMRCYELARVIEARRPPTLAPVAAPAQPEPKVQPVEVRVVLETGDRSQSEPIRTDRRMLAGPVIDLEPGEAQNANGATGGDVGRNGAEHWAQFSLDGRVRNTAPLPENELEALKKRAICDIAKATDSVRVQKPVSQHLEFVARVAVMAADVVHAAPSVEAIAAAKARVLAALRHA